MALLLLSSCSSDKCNELCEELNSKQEEINNFRPSINFDYEVEGLMKIKNKMIDEALSIKRQMKESNCDCEINGVTVEYEDYL
jgi:pentatricopeptide repeat protein